MVAYVFNKHTIFGIKHLWDLFATCETYLPLLFTVLVHTIPKEWFATVCVRMFQEIWQRCIDIIGVDKGPTVLVLSGGRGVGCGGSNLEYAEICNRFFQTGFQYSDRRQCSGFLLWDQRVTSLIIIQGTWLWVMGLGYRPAVCGHVCTSLWRMRNAVKCDHVTVNISQPAFHASPCHFWMASIFLFW
jgi:hypothetical protein